MDSLKTAFDDFYTYLPSFSDEWIENVKRSAPICTGLKNLQEQLSLIDRSNWNQNLLDEFPDVQEKLINKILVNLEEETYQLREISKNLLFLKKTLNQKFELIERNSYKLNLSSKICDIGPPVCTLIEYAENVIRYYSSLYIQLEVGLAALDYKDRKTVIDVEEAFHKSLNIHKTVSGLYSKYHDGLLCLTGQLYDLLLIDSREEDTGLASLLLLVQELYHVISCS